MLSAKKGSARRLFASLNREQKEAIGLLQIGTFLEYFDLMLYVHMAVVLNDLFFPITDPHTAALLAALAFCSTYVMRPIGALIFGWLGDNIGRKSTIIITTVMMSVSCLLMANLPTYAQIGITAAWIMTLCRIVQGMSSMGEIIGAEIYVAECVPRPASYPAVACIILAASVGAMAATGIASLVMSFLLNWRIAFWIGAGIALVGAVARTRLRETPDFLKLKREKMKATIAELSFEEDQIYSKRSPSKTRPAWKEPIKTKTLMSYLFLNCGWPLCFYLSYIYFNPLLRENFSYSSENIIFHNFLLSIFMVTADTFWAYLSAHFHPLKLLKVRWVCAVLVMISLPFLIPILNNPYQLFLIQSSIIMFSLAAFPADAILIYHLPIYRRFTFASFIYALSRALMYIITSFGLVYLGSFFGLPGILLIIVPILLANVYGIYHFVSLERGLGLYTDPSTKTDKGHHTNRPNTRISS
jgi:MHS family proline/betaine transporter-like MFS transporter